MNGTASGSLSLHALSARLRAQEARIGKLEERQGEQMRWLLELHQLQAEVSALEVYRNDHELGTRYKKAELQFRDMFNTLVQYSMQPLSPPAPESQAGSLALRSPIAGPLAPSSASSVTATATALAGGSGGGVLPAVVGGSRTPARAGHLPTPSSSGRYESRSTLSEEERERERDVQKGMQMQVELEGSQSRIQRAKERQRQREKEERAREKERERERLEGSASTRQRNANGNGEKERERAVRGKKRARPPTSDEEEEEEEEEQQQEHQQRPYGPANGREVDSDDPDGGSPAPPVAPVDFPRNRQGRFARVYAVRHGKRPERRSAGTGNPSGNANANANANGTGHADESSELSEIESDGHEHGNGNGDEDDDSEDETPRRSARTRPAVTYLYPNPLVRAPVQPAARDQPGTQSTQSSPTRSRARAPPGENQTQTPSQTRSSPNQGKYRVGSAPRPRGRSQLDGDVIDQRLIEFLLDAPRMINGQLSWNEWCQQNRSLSKQHWRDRYYGRRKEFDARVEEIRRERAREATGSGSSSTFSGFSQQV